MEPCVKAQERKSASGQIRDFKNASGLWARVEEAAGSSALSVLGYAASQTALDDISMASAPKGSAAARSQAEMDARLCVDAWRALGGKAPMHSGQSSINGMPWALWVAAMNPDYSDQKAREKGDELNEELNELVERASSTSSGLAFLARHVEWCFHSDAEYTETAGYWSPGDAVEILGQPKDYRGSEPGVHAMPFDFMNGVDHQSEGVWGLSFSGGAKSAMNQAYDHLAALGFEFSISMQKEFGMDSDHNESYPLHKKVDEIIDARKAAKEARQISRVTRPGAASKTARM